MNNTGIDWTELTWNPVTGCTKVSSGCKNCYAEPLAKRLKAMGNPRHQAGFDTVVCHRDKVDEPRKIRGSKLVFVNSMSDMLHRDVPTDFIVACVRSMAATRHRFQVLSKRARRWPAVSYEVDMDIGEWPANVWPGVSIEDRRHMNRLDGLADVGDNSTIRMVSFEPLLEDLGWPAEIAKQLTNARIGWVITGGESGFDARPAELDWFRHIRDACHLAGVPFFHKQHGGRGVTHAAKRGGKHAILDGVLIQEYPRESEGQPSLF